MIITALQTRMTHREPSEYESDTSEEIPRSYSSNRRRDSFRMHISQLQESASCYESKQAEDGIMIDLIDF